MACQWRANDMQNGLPAKCSFRGEQVNGMPMACRMVCRPNALSVVSKSMSCQWRAEWFAGQSPFRGEQVNVMPMACRMVCRPNFLSVVSKSMSCQWRAEWFAGQMLFPL